MNKIVSAIAACAAMAVALSGHAQTQYPSKPVRLLIPFPPGGPTDSAVRVFLPALSQALGQVDLVLPEIAVGGGVFGLDVDNKRR
jgi:tripartite-type tricarboxylate transporter receptor subunit TctC